MLSTDSLHKKFSLFKEVNQHWARLVLDVVTSALLYLRVEPWHDPT